MYQQTALLRVIQTDVTSYGRTKWI